MTENDLDFVLDGNAAAGALREIFAAEMTTARYSMRCMRLSRRRGFSALLMRLRWESCCGARIAQPSF